MNIFRNENDSNQSDEGWECSGKESCCHHLASDGNCALFFKPVLHRPNFSLVVLLDGLQVLLLLLERGSDFFAEFQIVACFLFVRGIDQGLVVRFLPFAADDALPILERALLGLLYLRVGGRFCLAVSSFYLIEIACLLFAEPVTVFALQGRGLSGDGLLISDQLLVGAAHFVHGLLEHASDLFHSVRTLLEIFNAAVRKALFLSIDRVGIQRLVLLCQLWGVLRLPSDCFEISDSVNLVCINKDYSVTHFSDRILPFCGIIFKHSLPLLSVNSVAICVLPHSFNLFCSFLVLFSDWLLEIVCFVNVMLSGIDTTVPRVEALVHNIGVVENLDLWDLVFLREQLV